MFSELYDFILVVKILKLANSDPKIIMMRTMRVTAMERAHRNRFDRLLVLTYRIILKTVRIL